MTKRVLTEKLCECGRWYNGTAQAKVCPLCAEEIHREHVRERKKRRELCARKLGYHVTGWKRMPGIPERDYLDFQDSHISNEQVRVTLEHGYFPPGLILEKKHKRVIVVGSYEHKQSLRSVEV